MDSFRISPSRLRTRRKRNTKRAFPAVAAVVNATTNPDSKKKRKKKSVSAPAMVGLAGGPMRIPEGLKEGRRAGMPRLHKQNASQPLPSSVRSTVQPPKRPSVSGKMLGGLACQSMSQLRQLWINLQQRITEEGRLTDLTRLEGAILHEWDVRHRTALEDPDYFDWPSTMVGKGDGSMPFDSWHSEGMLAYLGYHVGTIRGVATKTRRQILDTVFAHTLPPVNGPEYLNDWGVKATALRLRRLAEELARLARNAKRKRSSNMDQAVADWEADLKYLYDRYYVDRFRFFTWPTLDR